MDEESWQPRAPLRARAQDTLFLLRLLIYVIWNRGADSGQRTWSSVIMKKYPLLAVDVTV